MFAFHKLMSHYDEHSKCTFQSTFDKYLCFFLIQQRIRLFNIISPPGSADNGNDSLSEEDVARGKRVSSCSRYLTLSPGPGHCHTRQGEQRLVGGEVVNTGACRQLPLPGPARAVPGEPSPRPVPPPPARGHRARAGVPEPHHPHIPPG